VVVACRSPDPRGRERAVATISAIYWRPIYKYLRARHRRAPADAEDLTQELFRAALERGFFERYDPAKARFHTYLRLCVDALCANEDVAARRQKRGGEAVRVSLAAPGELAAVETELSARPGAVDDPEAYFHAEWIRSLFHAAVEELRTQCAASGRELRFRVFERYDLEGPNDPSPPSYVAVGAELGISASDVTNHLSFARRELRRLVLDRLAKVAGSDEELDAEARALFGG
jgi:RNA polymerase sigma factor (sigma-70 family)